MRNLRRTKIHKTVSAKSEPVWPRLAHLSREVLRPIWSVVVEVGLGGFLFSIFGVFRIFISFIEPIEILVSFAAHSLWKDPNILHIIPCWQEHIMLCYVFANIQDM